MWRRQLYSLEVHPEFDKIDREAALHFWEPNAYHSSLFSFARLFKTYWLEENERDKRISNYDMYGKLEDFTIIPSIYDVEDKTEFGAHVGGLHEFCEYFNLNIPEKEIQNCVKRCEISAWLEGVKLRRELNPDELAERVKYRRSQIESLEERAKNHKRTLFKADTHYEYNFLVRKAVWGMFLMEIRFQKKKLEGMGVATIAF